MHKFGVRIERAAGFLEVSEEGNTSAIVMKVPDLKPDASASTLSPNHQIGNPMKRRRTPWSARLCMAILLGRSGDLVFARAQSPPLNPELVAAKWPASWIASPSAPAKAPGVFYFRKEMVLTTVPQHYWVHVSADNRLED